MDRRRLIAAVGASMLVAPLRVSGQTAARVYRIGTLSAGTRERPDEVAGSASQLSNLLRELGYVEGRNLIVDRKYAEGNFDRLPKLAQELTQLRVDVIYAIGTAPIQAAKAATTTIPIVFLSNFDPVAAGLVESLARPGTNVTGILITPEGSLAGKKLELLREAVPRATRIALLVPDDPYAGTQQQIQEVRKAASSLGVELAVILVHGNDYAGAFDAAAAERQQALIVGAHSFFVRDQKKIIELAATYRLPAIYEWPQQVQNGGLMSYGASQVEVYKEVAVYIDRVLKGASPADLPIWQPEKLRFVLNLRTAKALGLAVPQSLLLRADEVIQ
jgi:putative ABC transport system substrate-binding protein